MVNEGLIMSLANMAYHNDHDQMLEIIMYVFWDDQVNSRIVFEAERFHLPETTSPIRRPHSLERTK